MNEEISKFVLGRLNLRGKSEPTELQDAYLKFKSCMDNLRKTLSDEQKKLLTGVHDVYLSFTGSMNINWFSFTAPEATETVYPAADPEAPVGTPLLGNLDGDRAITAVDAVTASDALQILQNATNKVTDLHTS